MDGQVVLVEFNELSPTLLRRFMREGALPNFSRLHDGADVFETDAGETGATLVPWIQWPSVHTGAPYAEHGLFHLGEAHRSDRPTIASVLAEAGIPVGVFGAMNVPAPARFDGFRLPDPWDKNGVAVPSSLQPYYDATADQVKESSHHGRLTARDLPQLRVLRAFRGEVQSSARLGLTVGGTFAASGRSFASRSNSALMPCAVG